MESEFFLLKTMINRKTEKIHLFYRVILKKNLIFAK